MYHLLALGKADAFESVSKKNVFECLHLLMSGRLMVYTPQSSARQNEACLGPVWESFASKTSALVSSFTVKQL
jgi:hypothetical protein